MDRVKFGDYWAERSNYEDEMCDVRILDADKKPIGKQFRSRVDKVGEIIGAVTRYPVLMSHGWGKNLQQIFGFESIEEALCAIKKLGYNEENCDIFMSSELDYRGFQNYIV